MTNADVISLVKGGFNDDLIIAAIQRSQNKVFDLSTDGMLSMKKAGVSQRVIAVMLTGSATSSTLAVNSRGTGPSAGGHGDITIPTGTEVKFRVLNTVSSGTAKKGEAISLVVADDVVVNGEIVIAKDTPAHGTITEVVSQRLTRAGSIQFVVQSVKTRNMVDVSLRGDRSVKGGRGLVTANEALLESGTVITSTVEETPTSAVAAPAVGGPASEPTVSSSNASTGTPRRLGASCPVPGAPIPLGKATSASFAKDYQECDVVVEAVFFKMGNDGKALGKYDTKANTVFQVLEPDGAPQSRRGRETGTFAGTPKGSSNVLFELKQGDPILLRGHPVPISAPLVGIVLTVFHAETVTRK